MKLKVQLHRASGDPTDIVVTSDSTATVGDVARAIQQTDPTPERTDQSTRMTLRVAAPGVGDLVHLDPDTPLGDAAIGSGFDVAVAHALEYPSSAGVEAGDAAAVVRVMSGPDVGRETRLPLGLATVGRAPGNTIVLSDPLISGSHARIEISGGSIDIVDLNSANGILVDGGLVPRLRLPSGHSVLLGDSEISVTLLAGVADREDGIIERGGLLRFNRSPRVEARYLGREYPVPESPQEKDSQPFNWIIMIAPVIMGAIMFAITRNPASLGFIALSPMMAIGNYFSQRSRVGKKTKVEIERFELQLDDLQDQFQQEEPKERSVRLLESPAVADVYAEALRLGPMLWTRRPEHWNFLDLRLGLGSMPSRNVIPDDNSRSGLPMYTRLVDELRERVRFVADVPVVENPFLCGALGVCGGPTAVADATRALVVQYAGLHSPAEVAFAAVLAPTEKSQFDWLKWLPHTNSPHSPIQGVQLADSAATGISLLNALEEIIAVRRTQMKSSERGAGDESDAAASKGAKVGSRESKSQFDDGGAALVLLIANDAPVDRARLVQIVEDAADALVFPIWMAPTVEALPAACRTFMDVTNGLESAKVHFVRQGMVVDDVRVEGVSAEYALMLARRLAPVVDAGAVIADSSDLPASVPLLSLLGTELAARPQTAVDRWTQNKSIHDRSGRPPVPRKRAGTLRALVGQSSPDAMHLDLRTQGPHALVGGTTGSGKSEFLQAWVLGMAAEYSPDRVTFLFVDYKGGSAFAECVSLPHCVGLVTDLSPHLVRRALTSLRAELHHREHLFNRKKAKDLLELEKRGDPDCPPALILVIDEFAALAGDVPEFVDGVVDIAQRGRSLGIHLIMATQRPAGVIKDNLRANTNLRIALRMADESDSKDVVGDPVAGTFDPSLPGRGIAKTGPGRLVSFQSGYAGGWSATGPTRSEVKVAELRFGSTVLWESADAAADAAAEEDEDLGPNDQTRIVQTVVKAAELAGIPAPRRPWLDDLATAVNILDLPNGGDSRIALGLADIPSRQAQEAVYYDPDRDGAMLIYGTSGSGKTTALRSIAVSAGMRPDLGTVEVHGLDFGSGGLRSIESLPHVGSIVSGDDSERVQRLLRTLRAHLDERAKHFSEVNASSLTEYRELAGRPREPRILLLIDGFGTFKQDWDASSARSPYFNIFMRILGEGRPLGIHAIATADRYGAVPTSVSANVTKRIVLRMSDDGAYGMLGVPKDILGERSVPGRAVVDGLETQLAVLGGTSNVAQQSRDVEALAGRLRAAGATEVAEVGALPVELSIRQLPDQIDGMPVLGIGDDVLGPRGFEPTGTFVVTGPPRSGKTNALRAIITAVRRFDPDVKLFHFGGRRSQLRRYADWEASATTIEDVRALAKELTGLLPDESIPGKILMVVEGVTDFADSDAERALKELFQAVNRSEHFLIGDGDVSALGSGYGFIGDFKGGRRGIVLKPEMYDGDALFKLPFPRVQRHEFPEGRGIFVENGQLVTVQLPLVAVDAVPPKVGMGTGAHV